jgi:hypothetical protein
MTPNIKVEILHNVVQIETESKEPIHIQLVRGDKVELFQETPICLGRCPKCGNIFSVFFKKSVLKCPDCVTETQGFWTYAFVGTHGGYQQ